MLSSKIYSGFDPRSVASCSLWLDSADSNAIVLSGSNVTRWIDKSGNARHADVSQNAFATWSNTSSGVLLSNSLYTTPLSADPTTETAFMVYNYIGDGTNGIIVGAFTGGRELVVSNTTSVGAAKAGIQWVVTTSFTTSSVQLFTGQWSSSSTSASGNGGTPTTAGGITYTSSNVTLLGRENAVNFGARQTYVYELIFYPTLLTSSEIQQVQGYLSAKWGALKQGVGPTLSLSSIPAPTQISNLSMWYDAADESTLTLTGSNVTQWNDKSGNNFHITPLSGNSNATVSSNFQNGRTVLNFSGNNVYQTPSNTGVYPLDVYVVVALKSTSARADVIAINPVGNVDNFNALAYRISSGSWENGSSYATRFFSWSNSETSTGFLIMNWSLSNSNFLIRRNGTTIASNTSLTWTMTTPSRFQIGYVQSPAVGMGAQVQFNAYMGEVLIFNQQLADSNRVLVENYLASKWGLVSTLRQSGWTLPTTHPYRITPPLLRPFTPLDLSGLTVWLDAADETQIVYSTPPTVTQLRDKGALVSSSNVYSCTATRMSRGTIGNSLPTLSNATGATTRVHGITGNAPMTYVLVGKVNSSSNQIFIRGHLTSGGGDGFSGSLNFGISSNRTTPFLGINGVGGLVTGTATTSNAHVVIGSWDGTVGRIHDNGALTGTSSSTTLNQTSATTNLDFGNNELGEFMIFDRTLSESERQRLETYLASKWGLAGTTPSNHPVRISPALTPQFSPLLLGSCALWLDAADRSTLTLSGSNATAWRDKSPLARTYSGNVLYTAANGYPCLRFAATRMDSTSNYTTSDLTVNNAHFTCFTVINVSNTTAVNSVGVAFFWVANGAWRFASFYSSNSATGFFDGAFADNPRLFFPYTQNTRQIHGFNRNSTSNMVFRRNGAAVASNTRVGASNWQASSAYAGALGDAFRGDIHEVIYFSNDIGVAACQQIEGYLARKWGLLSDLSSTNPYKATPLF